jgi:hypothetical protein
MPAQALLQMPLFSRYLASTRELRLVEVVGGVEMDSS